MVGMDVPTLPPIDPIVSDFPIFSALGNDGAQSVDFGPESRQNWGVFARQFFRGNI